MNILKTDLFKNKYFNSVLVLLSVVVGVLWFMNYNSVESKCSRYYKKLGVMLGAGGSKLKDLQLETASRSSIKKCIDQGGPLN